jgi:hypothetical protein
MAGRAVTTEPTHFTSRISTGAGGIGDQLFQLQVLYNLGRSAGWHYLHDTTPGAWVNHDRPTLPQRFDYHALLGLTLGERSLSEIPTPKFVELDARRLLEKLTSKSDYAPTKRIVRLRFHPWFYHHYERSPSERAVPCRYRLDVERTYALARRDDPIALPFRSGTIPIVVFLRLMELVFYEHDGSVVVPSFPRSKFVAGHVNPPSRVLAMLQALVALLAPRPCEIWVYSDGLPERDMLVRWILARTRSRKAAEAEADRALDFQREALRNLESAGAPVHFSIEGSIALVREVVHAFSVAPFALNSRSCHLGRWTIRTGFPDLGQRSSDLFPVITPDRTPESLADAVRAYANAPGRFSAWGVD